MNGAVTFRDPRPEDRERLMELLHAQAAQFGEDGLVMYTPDLTDAAAHPSIVYARVAEKDGKVIGCWFGQINIELETVAEDKDFYRALPAEIEMAARFFKERGIRMGRGFVPKKRSRFMRAVFRSLPFIERVDKYEHFCCDFSQVEG